jgi:DNA-directed RNA polymerase subunit RPC12/RpoP
MSMPELICIRCKKEIHTEVDNFQRVNESKSEYAHIECPKKTHEEYNQGMRLNPDDVKPDDVK